MKCYEGLFHFFQVFEDQPPLLPLPPTSQLATCDVDEPGSCFTSLTRGGAQLAARLGCWPADHNRVLEGEQCFRESQSTVCLCNAQLCNNFLPAAVEQVVPEGNLGQVLVLMLLLLIVLAVLAGALYTLCRGLRRRRGQRLDTSCSAHRLTFHLANSPPPAAELTTYRYFAVSERPQHGGGQLPLPNHSEKEEKSQKSDGKNTSNQMHNSPSENLRPEATVPILCYASHYI